jgi:hypothetical protein
MGLFRSKLKVDWIYQRHADGSVLRHMFNGPTQHWDGDDWVQSHGCSFGQHPNGVPRVGRCEIKKGELPDYLNESWAR